MGEANSLRRVALLLAYDGRRYAGWQRQANAVAVQNRLETALGKLCKEKIQVAGSSRTDAGVHAAGLVCHFDSHARIPLDRLPLALSTVLPPDIICLQAAEVSPEFHARFSARGKQYSYYIWNDPRPQPFFAGYAYHEPRPLDLEAMLRIPPLLCGEHDFRAFQAAGSPSSSTLRRLYSVQVAQLHTEPFTVLAHAAEAPSAAGLRPEFAPLRQAGEHDAALFPPYLTERISGAERAPAADAFKYLGLVRIVVHGSGFLYNMMRIIAGTLLYAGLHKLDAEDVQQALATGNRLLCGKTLEPQGLCLDRVDYDPPVFRYEFARGRG